METTTKFSFSVIGEQTGKPYNGDFTVKTVISRRENFIADERRRLLIGANASSVSQSVNGEAYMFGQLSVRIVSAPDWWNNADNGVDLEDDNVAPELYNLIMEKADEHRKKIKESAEKAVEKMSKKEIKASKE